MSWNFQIALYGGSPLKPSQSGTLHLLRDGQEVAGTLTLAEYKEPISVTGSINKSGSYDLITAQGENSEVQTSFSILESYGGFRLQGGTYCGGVMTMLDFSMREEERYVVQGVTT